MTFIDPSDYDKVLEDDRISIIDLAGLKPKQYVVCKLHHNNGVDEVIHLQHSYNDDQLKWFQAGSALNLLRSIHTK